MSVGNVKGLAFVFLTLAAIGMPARSAIRTAPMTASPKLIQGRTSIPLEDVDQAVVSVLDAKLGIEALVREVDEYLPRAGEVVSEKEVVAAWAFFSSRLSQLEKHSKTLGTNTDAFAMLGDEPFLVHDFSALDYARFYEDECSVLLQLTDGKHCDPRRYLDEARRSGDPALLEKSTINVVLSKILSILGVGSFVQAFDEALSEQAGPTLKAIGKAIKNKNVKAIPKLFKRLLGTVTSPPFRKALVRKIGKKAAGKALAKIAGKAVPVVGWGVLAGSFAWTLYEQYTATA